MRFCVGNSVTVAVGCNNELVREITNEGICSPSRMSSNKQAIILHQFKRKYRFLGGSGTLGISSLCGSGSSGGSVPVTTLSARVLSMVEVSNGSVCGGW